MPVNWDEFEHDLDSIIDGGARRADERLASRISSVTRMTDDEVKQYFPSQRTSRNLRG
jgi:hypothetical protein